MEPSEAKRIRALTGLDREHFAKAFGYSKARLAAYENGSRRISEKDEAYYLKLQSLYEDFGEEGLGSDM